MRQYALADFLGLADVDGQVVFAVKQVNAGAVRQIIKDGSVEMRWQAGAGVLFLDRGVDVVAAAVNLDFCPKLVNQLRIGQGPVAAVGLQAVTLDQAVEAFHRRPLSNRYKALLFDGVVLARKTGAGARRRPVLVAVGILPDKRKEVIDFLLAKDESQAAWEGLLNLLATGELAAGPEGQPTLAERAALGWLQADPAAARAWLTNAPLPAQLKQKLLRN